MRCHRSTLPSDRDNEHRKIGILFGHFQTERSLACDYILVVERMDKRVALAPSMQVVSVELPKWLG
jgi:hypothetical protein